METPNWQQYCMTAMTFNPKNNPAAPPTSEKNWNDGYVASSAIMCLEFSDSFQSIVACFKSESYVNRVKNWSVLLRFTLLGYLFSVLEFPLIRIKNTEWMTNKGKTV